MAGKQGNVRMQSEASTSFYDNSADLSEAKSRLVEQTSVHYALCNGHTEAEHVIVVSGAATCGTAKYLQDKGDKVGILKARLFGPWGRSRFMSALPTVCKRICALDGTQEQGSQGERLFLEASTALKAMAKPNIVRIGGRYGLGSKEFIPDMVPSVYENLHQVLPRYMKPNGVCGSICSWSVSELATKKAKFYIIDAAIAVKVSMLVSSWEAGLGKRINMIMTVFCKLSCIGLVPEGGSGSDQRFADEWLGALPLQAFRSSLG